MSISRALCTIALSVLTSGCAALNDRTVAPPVLTNEPAFQRTKDKIKPSSAPLIVGVYGFADQTGQRAVLDRHASELSTAVPQGLASMLVQELLSLDDGLWFRVVERENVSSLLNERNIVKVSLGEEEAKQLPQLLLPGIILTGGAVSYDRKVRQIFGGVGFASVNGQREIYSDQVSVALRAVSVQTGEVLESVYVSKEILSQMNGISGLEVLNHKALALESGAASNEPVSLAIRIALSEAVLELRKRGLKRGWWTLQVSPSVTEKAVAGGTPSNETAKVSKVKSTKKL